MRLFAGTPFDIPPTCDHCSKSESECQCTAQQKARLSPAKQTATLAIEKRKKGKVVTVVYGLPAIGNDLPNLLRTLKNACGAGGTVEGDTIEVQGEHRDRMKQELERLGYKVKLK